MHLEFLAPFKKARWGSMLTVLAEVLLGRLPVQELASVRAGDVPLQEWAPGTDTPSGLEEGAPCLGRAHWDFVRVWEC